MGSQVQTLPRPPSCVGRQKASFAACPPQPLAKRGDEVRLVGFGNFSVTRRKASTGRNPRTGEPMQIKASSQPKFRPGKVLKDAVQA